MGPFVRCLFTLAVLASFLKVVKEDKVCNMCCIVALLSSFSPCRTLAARTAVPVTEVSHVDTKQLAFPTSVINLTKLV